ncbi:23S rRNA (uracil(1939)-C(5))-methyltransferase RlmD [Defluviimonas aquaemixtae]|uniref:23S rRNA (Uracil(1939)-C(5))-methyltransferase RlmD n=1 Tax=Albidovulum aquaemixtae TaxID=1542388 RepID=A0A2R8BJJ7_9RHOB|nr:class I SAM-dependent RNA methyltransferase [Defluviimonas aquaemixtae]SPH23576.1 23S rRNA (uracil(1939)-C(5))-methyltransferase RlmD [Defluviimonas aquaemixtae]
MRLTVERLGHLGDGIAPGPVYVPMSLPGEEVEGEIVGGRMVAPRIVTPSRDRVAPACPHYKVCGGCSLMHASDAFVAEWKADVVRNALQAHGLSAPLRPVVTSRPGSRRRATLTGRRTKKGALVGFHGKASETIVEIPNCRLLHPRLMATLSHLAELVRLGASRKGVLSMTLTLTDDGVDLAVTGGRTTDRDLLTKLVAFAGRAGVARLSWDGDVVVTAAPMRVQFGVAAVRIPPGAFLQATADGEVALVRGVSEAVSGARQIADLFAGAGTFTLPLARHAVLHAVEGDSAMLDALGAAWRMAEDLHGVTTEARDLFRRPLMPDELRRFDAVVFDPPRAGAEAQSRELATSAVPVVAAVSCNPVSFARDARILANGGYAIDWIQVVDQFRWSPHVELVARLSRPARRRTIS